MKYHRKLTIQVRALRLTKENPTEVVALVKAVSPDTLVFRVPVGLFISCQPQTTVWWDEYLVCEPNATFRAMDEATFRQTYAAGWPDMDARV